MWPADGQQLSPSPGTHRSDPKESSHPRTTEPGGTSEEVAKALAPWLQSPASAGSQPRPGGSPQRPLLHEPISLICIKRSGRPLKERNNTHRRRGVDRGVDRGEAASAPSHRDRLKHVCGGGISPQGQHLRLSAEGSPAPVGQALSWAGQVMGTATSSAWGLPAQPLESRMSQFSSRDRETICRRDRKRCLDVLVPCSMHAFFKKEKDRRF